MAEAVAQLDFETAAIIRDEIKALHIFADNEKKAAKKKAKNVNNS
jgi:protein-arginine kinase activator protein McsA